MRLALLLPVLFCVAAPAHAEGARESRYGPTTPRQTSAAATAVATRYDGPMLSWANKREAPSDPVTAATPTSTPAQPAPLAAWAGYSARPEPVAYAPPVAPTFAPRPTALPTSLYAAPRPSPVAVATPAPARPAPLRDRASYDRPPAPAAVQPAASRPSPVVGATPGPARDWSSYRSVRMATAASAPAAAPVSAPAPAPAPPPPAPRQIAAANTGVTGARFYSVARESGLTPDPIPPAGPDHQVLITTDAPPSPAEDAAPMHGSADWLAAGARGDDDGDGDDSAARRAKPRKQGL
ncbi:hypothetical protein [Caulobacter sp. BK020]|uniref:hypothetical protein n=1 Tax=Caulobacter sp. BK020 TaxID=2512117 RepID=UPI00104D7E61|nr:hypothetical protein [Caulobacter sp. BK020]TCS13630.1 hypothetical protein EV278_10990 [Caulobacter sp. BK020]